MKNKKNLFLLFVSIAALVCSIVASITVENNLNRLKQIQMYRVKK